MIDTVQRMKNVCAHIKGGVLCRTSFKLELPLTPIELITTEGVSFMAVSVAMQEETVHLSYKLQKPHTKLTCRLFTEKCVSAGSFASVEWFVTCFQE